MVNTEFRSFLFDPVSLFHSVGDRSLFMFNVHTAESVIVISGLLFSAPIRPVIRRTPLFVGRVTAEYANRDRFRSRATVFFIYFCSQRAPDGYEFPSTRRRCCENIPNTRARSNATGVIVSRFSKTLRNKPRDRSERDTVNPTQSSRPFAARFRNVAKTGLG